LEFDEIEWGQDKTQKTVIRRTTTNEI